MFDGYRSNGAIRPDYSVIVPCYNSAATIGELCRSLGDTFERMGSSYEILAIDDASTDGLTWQAIIAAAASCPIRAFQLTRNSGRTAAVLCGLKRARGERVIIMDDDLQHRPEEIPRLAEQGAHDAVVADFPYRERHHSRAQRWTSWLRHHFETRILGKPHHIRMSPFIMIRAQIVRMMLRSRTQRPYLPALLLDVTRDIVSVHVPHAPRQAGRSSFGLLRRLEMFSNLIFNHSSVLLRAMAVAGGMFAGLAIVMACCLSLAGLRAPRPAPAWGSIVLTVFLDGSILLALGIIGEYIARLIQLGERRPLYYVRTSYEFDGGFEGPHPGQVRGEQPLRSECI